MTLKKLKNQPLNLCFVVFKNPDRNIKFFYLPTDTRISIFSFSKRWLTTLMERLGKFAATPLTTFGDRKWIQVWNFVKLSQRQV